MKAAGRGAAGMDTRAHWLLLVGAILMLAGGLRWHNLDAQSLWYDEGVAYAHSLRTLPELIPRLRNNVHVPAYFALLGLWQDLAGSSELALRALSVFCSLASVAFAYALGKRLFHPLAGCAAAALVALNTFSIHYAQEARMYALLCAVAGVSYWLALDVLGGGSRSSRVRRIAALGLVNALGMYTHVAFALVIASQVALAAFELRRPARWRQGVDFVIAGFVCLLLFAPWLPISISQLSAQPNLAPPLDLGEAIRVVWGHLVFGSAFEHGPPLALGWGAGILLLAGLLPARGRKRAELPLFWTMISVAAYLGLALGERYLRFLLPAQLAAALWMGRGVWILWRLGAESRWRRLSRLAAVIGLAGCLATQALSLDALYYHPDFQRDDMRGLVEQIEESLGEHDALIVSAAGLSELLDYYYSADAPVYALPTSPDEDVTRAQVREIVARHDQLHAIFYGEAEQDPTRAVETTLNTEAYEISEVWVDDLRYVRYAGEAPLDPGQKLQARFGSVITLRGVALSGGSFAPGDVIRARFVWSAADTLERRYKVFMQLLNAEGMLVAQRDSEPAGGSAPTTAWKPGISVVDNHGLLVPRELAAGEYRLIAGLYDAADPSSRLEVAGGNYFDLGILFLE